MPKEHESFSEIEKNVEYLRNKLVRYQSLGVAPPVKLLFELRMAERILKLESIDTMRVSVKNTNRINIKV